MFTPITNDTPGAGKDLMASESLRLSTKPFGGDEDFVWNPNGKEVVCTNKKLFELNAISTKTPIYILIILKQELPKISPKECLVAMLIRSSTKKETGMAGMKRAGYEADKQDIIVSNGVSKMNLTVQRDDIHVKVINGVMMVKNFSFMLNGTL